MLQEETGLELTDKLKALAQILEIIRIEEIVPGPQRGKRGGQEIDRRPLARAFLTKAFFNLGQTRALKEQLDQSSAMRALCGMETSPSEATFSRAFSEFAQMKLGQLAHAALVTKFVSPQIVMHISHDSTAIEAREKAQKKVKPPRVKKSVVVPRKERSELLKSPLGYSSKSIYPQSKHCQSCLRLVTLESSETRMGMSTAGGATRRICLGLRA